MSVSPKHNHSTPFSVTDILNPIEDLSNIANFNLKKTALDAAIPALGAYSYRSPGSQGMGSMNSMSGMSVPVTNPYHNYVPQLSHHAPSFPSQYCNGSDYYGDAVRSSTSWYNTGTTDPRLASEYYQFSSWFRFRPFTVWGSFKSHWVKNLSAESLNTF